MVNAETIVFVHLGDFLPRWIIPNVLDHKSRFSNSTVVIVDDDEVAKRLEKSGIDVWLRRPAKNLGSVYAGDEATLSFRRNFWRTTSDRFVALAEYQLENQGSIIQVETDTVLLDTFHDVNVTGIVDQIAYPIASMKYGLGSVVFFPTYKLSSLVAQFFTGIKSPHLEPTTVNDMTRLSDFFKDHEELVYVLPTGFDSSDTDSFGGDLELKEIVTANQTDQDAIFDALTIGQFLTGQDPRNGRGLKRVHSNSEGFFPTQPAFKYSMHGENLFVRSLDGDEEAPVVNLHVHSKDLRYFRQKTRGAALKECLFKVETTRKWEFDSWGFRSYLAEKLRTAPRRMIGSSKPKREY